MRKLIFITILIQLIISHFATVSAQDTLFLFHETPIAAKVLELNKEEVKYKRVDFADGPTYIAKLGNVFYIKYSNGLYDTLTKTETEKVAINLSAATYNPYPKIIHKLSGGYSFNNVPVKEYQLYERLSMYDFADLQNKIKRAKRAKTIQNISFYAGLFIVPLALNWATVVGVDNTFTFGNSSPEESYIPPLAIGAVGAACMSTSFAFHIKRLNRRKDIITFYNNKYYTPISPEAPHPLLKMQHNSNFAYGNEAVDENEIFDKLSMLNDSKLNTHIALARRDNKLKRTVFIGSLVVAASAIVLASIAGYNDPYNQNHQYMPTAICGSVAVGGGVGASLFAIKKNYHKRRIERIYNQKFYNLLPVLVSHPVLKFRKNATFLYGNQITDEDDVFEQLSLLNDANINYKINMTNQKRQLRNSLFVCFLTALPCAIALAIGTGINNPAATADKYIAPISIGALGVGCGIASFVFQIEKDAYKMSLVNIYNKYK